METRILRGNPHKHKEDIKLHAAVVLGWMAGPAEFVRIYSCREAYSKTAWTMGRARYMIPDGYSEEHPGRQLKPEYSCYISDSYDDYTICDIGDFVFVTVETCITSVPSVSYK